MTKEVSIGVEMHSTQLHDLFNDNRSTMICVPEKKGRDTSWQNWRISEIIFVLLREDI